MTSQVSLTQNLYLNLMYLNKLTMQLNKQQIYNEVHFMQGGFFLEN